jgi:Helix-turn-helix domain
LTVRLTKPLRRYVTKRNRNGFFYAFFLSFFLVNSFFGLSKCNVPPLLRVQYWNLLSPFRRGPEMFTVQDIQERYSVTVNTVLGWIRSGELRAVNVGRHLGKKKPRWRITQQALEAFEQLRTPTPPPPKMPRRKQAAGVIEFYK